LFGLFAQQKEKNPKLFPEPFHMQSQKRLAHLWRSAGCFKMVSLQPVVDISLDRQTHLLLGFKWQIPL